MELHFLCLAIVLQDTQPVPGVPKSMARKFENIALSLFEQGAPKAWYCVLSSAMYNCDLASPCCPHLVTLTLRSALRVGDPLAALEHAD